MSLGGFGLGEFEFGGGEEEPRAAFFIPSFLRITPTRSSVRIMPYEAGTAITPHNASLEVTGA